MKQTELCLKQGATFNKVWTWLSGDDVVKPITAAVLGYQTLVTATAHGLPQGWIPVTLLDVGDLSSKSLNTWDRVPAKKVDVNTFHVNVDSTGFAPIVSGELVYTPPRDLTGYSASALFVANVNDMVPLLVLSDLNGGVVLGGTEGTIEMSITAAQSALYAADYSYWQLSLVDPTGVVIRFAEGGMTLDRLYV